MANELLPAHELVMGLETSRGWGPVHFAQCARLWLHAFAEAGQAEELRKLEDLVRAALYHNKWAELGKHLYGVYQTYDYKHLLRSDKYTDIRKKQG